MAWELSLVIMTRELIGDTDSSNYVYTDARVQSAIVTAAIISSQEYTYINSYIFDLETPEITPDPTDISTYDQAAIALFSLKAACILNMNSYQSSVKNGIKVRDGDSEVDTTGGFKGFQDILKLGPCASYEKVLSGLSSQAIGTFGRAVMTPVNIYGFQQSDGCCAERFYNSLF